MRITPLLSEAKVTPRKLSEAEVPPRKLSEAEVTS